MRLKIIFIIIFICSASFAFSPFAFTEIGCSIEEFTKSKFVQTYDFTLIDSWKLTSPKHYAGKYYYSFVDPEERYELGMIADKNGKNIVKQTLVTPYLARDNYWMKDSLCRNNFINEATGSKVNETALSSFIKEVVKKPLQFNKEFKKHLADYDVSISIMQTGSKNQEYKEWLIQISK